MMNLNSYLTTHSLYCKNKVYFLSDPARYKEKEQVYLQIRLKEGRIYSDQILRNLPMIEKSHPLYQEWLIRGKSFRNLSVYLANREMPLRILDLGCGNGWMSNQLAKIEQCQVYAADIGVYELEQGANVFGSNQNLTFFFGDIFEEIFPANSFDVIVLASLIQYFPDLYQLLERLSSFLRNNGEIHIIDSPFYNKGSVHRARQRSIEYYTAKGVPEMVKYYFHHLFSDLKPFTPTILNNPNTIFHKAIGKLIHHNNLPFPWIKLQF